MKIGGQQLAVMTGCFFWRWVAKGMHGVRLHSLTWSNQYEHTMHMFISHLNICIICVRILHPRIT